MRLLKHHSSSLHDLFLEKKKEKGMPVFLIKTQGYCTEVGVLLNPIGEYLFLEDVVEHGPSGNHGNCSPECAPCW